MVMRRNTHFEQNEIFLIAAAIVAHMNFMTTGFRQKHLKFLIEMFSNWMDVVLKERTLVVHNTQVMRYLSYLTQEGFARSFVRAGQPHYRLTRVGLITLIGKLTQRQPQFPLEHFYFVFHCVETYREALETLVKAEGQQFPMALKIELDSMLDARKTIEAQIHFVDMELKKLKQRVEENQGVMKLVKQFRQAKKPTPELVLAIEKQFPYDLNSQKPLSEFYEEIPPKMRDFVLDTAIQKRVQQIWLPVLAALEKHLEILQQLKANLRPVKPFAKL